MTASVSIDQLCINTIRTLAIDAVQKANSGHPGLPLGAAPMAYVLWQHHLRHNPSNPEWPDRDRFVLSAGHGCMLLYALLHLTGYDVSIEDIQNFRQWGSRVPGHPESLETPGVEASTGPLGQGTANAVGMAIAERTLANRFNRSGYDVVNHHTYALVSDGDMMEGLSAEAASIAGHLKLGKLIYLYDSNNVTLDGPASLTFTTEDVGRRYEAYGWQVLKVQDGDNDLVSIDQAIRDAQSDTSRPSLIIICTTIGFGSPHKQGTSGVHGAPLGVEEVALTKKALGWDGEEPFHISDEVLQHFREAGTRGELLQSNWQERLANYRTAYTDAFAEWERRISGELPTGWDEGLPVFEKDSNLATREASGMVLNAIAAQVPELIGGDADLSTSTKTALNDMGSFDGQTGSGRNIHFGVREHAMGSIVNGLAYHGGVRGYTATFFVFSDYMRPAVRLAALSKLPVTFIWTHDSIGVGEDGPTHQPVEHLASLRVMPNLAVIRPADASETIEAWRVAMERRDGPTALVLTRQKVRTLPRQGKGAAAGLRRGAYIYSNAGSKLQALIIATGSELEIAIAAQDLLANEGIGSRVISMPCWELFESESQEYRDSVLPPSIAPRVSVEAGSSFGWCRWIGNDGEAVSVNDFGASAPGDVNFAEYRITARNVVQAVKNLL